MIHAKTNEMLKYNAFYFSPLINLFSKSARVLAAMIYICGSVCFPSVNVIAYIQVLLHFYYNRNKLHFYFFGTRGGPKTSAIDKLAPLFKLHGE
jgi:hypothetical protein